MTARNKRKGLKTLMAERTADKGRTAGPPVSDPEPKKTASMSKPEPDANARMTRKAEPRDSDMAKVRSRTAKPQGSTLELDPDDVIDEVEAGKRWEDMSPDERDNALYEMIDRLKGTVNKIVDHVFDSDPASISATFDVLEAAFGGSEEEIQKRVTSHFTATDRETNVDAESFKKLNAYVFGIRRALDRAIEELVLPKLKEQQSTIQKQDKRIEALEAQVKELNETVKELKETLERRSGLLGLFRK